MGTEGIGKGERWVRAGAGERREMRPGEGYGKGPGRGGGMTGFTVHQCWQVWTWSSVFMKMHMLSVAIDSLTVAAL